MAADIDQRLEAFDGAIKAMLQEGVIRAYEGVMGCCDGRENPRGGEERRQGVVHQWKREIKDPLCPTTSGRSWGMPWVMSSWGTMRASCTVPTRPCPRRRSRRRTHKQGHMPQHRKRLGARLVERSVVVRTLPRTW
jgi:hypothetical protein